MEVDKSPSVSVAVLTYGEYSELASTLKSIVAQDYPVAEIIVSDDGSGREFPSEVVDSYDGIVAFQQSAANVGTVAHMNSLASRLQGTYLKFIATGDALNSQDALTRLVRWAEKECTVVTTSQAMVCNRTLEKKLYPFPRKKTTCKVGGNRTGAVYIPFCGELHWCGGDFIPQRFFCKIWRIFGRISAFRGLASMAAGNA